MFFLYKSFGYKHRCKAIRARDCTSYCLLYEFRVSVPLRGRVRFSCIQESHDCRCDSSPVYYDRPRNCDCDHVSVRCRRPRGRQCVFARPQSSTICHIHQFCRYLACLPVAVIAQKFWGHCRHQPLHYRDNFLRSRIPKKYELHIGLHLKSIINRVNNRNGLDSETRRNSKGRQQGWGSWEGEASPLPIS